MASSPFHEAVLVWLEHRQAIEYYRLIVVDRVVTRLFEPHLPQVCIHLVGQQHGQSRVDTLAHLGRSHH
ncbi:hypothetical protein D9M72_618800 [compost metagenome]